MASKNLTCWLAVTANTDYKQDLAQINVHEEQEEYKYKKKWKYTCR